MIRRFALPGLACFLTLAHLVPAHASSLLTLVDGRAIDGTVTVSTAEWKLVFSERFNWGPHQLYDLSFDPGASDNLATSSFGGTYSQGVLLGYNVYLGLETGEDTRAEFQTTLGENASPGTAQLDILEHTAARVRLRQTGHPRLNNATGPPSDPFPELDLVAFTKDWTIYPTGKVHIRLATALDPAGMIVDSGPGGAGKGIDAGGTAVQATGAADFLEVYAWPGDTIESAGGGWGPVLIIDRPSPTQLELATPVPVGNDLDYVIRRANILMETLTIHADGDPAVVNQCVDPATSRWQGGSNGDPLWSILSTCGNFLRTFFPPANQDFVIASWTRTRAYGGLLAFFEPWLEADFGVFNDTGYTDLSYTQLGDFGIRPFVGTERHFLAHMGSTSADVLPTIKSVADALPIAQDYRAPFAQALVGTLATGPGIAASGFNVATGAYEITAAGNVAVIRFNAAGGGRGGVAYRTPAVLLSSFTVPDEEVSVGISMNGGTSFATLDPALYNLTSETDQAEIGAGRRLFQYLGDVPASATGSNAVAFRFDAGGPVIPSIPLFTGAPTWLLAALLLGAAALRVLAQQGRSQRR